METFKGGIRLKNSKGNIVVSRNFITYESDGVEIMMPLDLLDRLMATWKADVVRRDGCWDTYIEERRKEWL